MFLPGSELVPRFLRFHDQRSGLNSNEASVYDKDHHQFPVDAALMRACPCDALRTREQEGHPKVRSVSVGHMQLLHAATADEDHTETASCSLVDAPVLGRTCACSVAEHLSKLWYEGLGFGALEAAAGPARDSFRSLGRVARAARGGCCQPWLSQGHLDLSLPHCVSHVGYKACITCMPCLCLL